MKTPTHNLSDMTTDAVMARYAAACQAIGREDPSLAITDSHADVEKLLAQREELVKALTEAQQLLAELVVTPNPADSIVVMYARGREVEAQCRAALRRATEGK